MADNAPIDLATIKDDLGIAADDTTNDEWLQRRINGVWARIEAYTDRKLCSPPAAFADDWSRIAEQMRWHIMPPSFEYAPTATVFLRYFPVTEVSAINIDGADGVADDVRFDPKTGKLFSLRAGELSWDLSRTLATSRVLITYKAGWATLPADLYEVVLGALQALWSAREAQSGAGTGGITQVAVQDVGSVMLGDSNSFVEGTMKGAGAISDPLLGPYASMLDLYIDHRSRIGWAYQPVTTSAGP